MCSAVPCLILEGLHLAMLNQALLKCTGILILNPRQHSPFRHPRRHKGVGVFLCDPPPSRSKLSVAELSGKHQRIALEEYSPLVCFFILNEKFDQVMRGQRSNFREIDNFFFKFTSPYLKNCLPYRNEKGK